MWLEAWEATEGLSPQERSEPEALRLRLLCCTGLTSWKLGDHLAVMLQDGTPEDREAAARYYHAKAGWAVMKGHLDEAREAVSAAIHVWPDIHQVILADPNTGPLR